MPVSLQPLAAFMAPTGWQESVWSAGDTRASTQQLPTITSGRAGDHIRESPAPPLQPVYALPPALAHDQARLPF